MIKVHLPDIITILSQTPNVVRELVVNLDEKWLFADEGPETWSPHSVVAHLIFGEKTDWIPRMEIILGNADDKRFTPFDRSGHFPLATGRSIEISTKSIRTITKGKYCNAFCHSDYC